MDSPCIKQTVCKVFKIFQCGKYLVAYVLNDVLRPVVVPFINNQNGPVMFQQDNARPHMARVTTQFLQGNNINVMQ